MKKFIRQVFVIVGLSVVTGISYNYFSRNPLPLTGKYDAHMVDLVISSKLNKKENPAVASPAETAVPTFQEIDADTLQSLVEAGKVILLDARTADEFNQGHIPGAVNLPITRFNATYGFLTSIFAENKMIICYCEGHDCTDSSLLAFELHKKGYKDIFVYKGGMAEWEQFTYPVETGQGHNEEGN
jgi:rhodanese-related sulfurtransferase